MQKKMIDSIFDNYLKQENTDFALLLTAKWGVGKTYYVKEYLKKPENKEIKTAYISLYGLSSTKEIDSQIFAKLYPGKNSVKKYGGLLLKIVSKNVDVSDFLKFDINKKTVDNEGQSIEGNLDGLDKIFELFKEKPDTNDSEKILICLDDLERRNDSFTLKEICGYINYLTENGFKVLVISNNEKIDNQDFKALKEKTFGNEVEFNPDTKTLSENVIKSTFTENGEYQSFLLSQILILMDVFFQHSHNLRIFKLILHKFKDVWEALNKKKTDFDNINLEDYWSSILRFMCAITIECREGKLLFEHREDIRVRFTWAEDLTDNYTNKKVAKEQNIEFVPQVFFSSYFGKKDLYNYIFYESVFDFIFKGLLDEEQLFIEFKEIDEILLDPTQIALKKCSDEHIGRISDEEFIHNLTLIRDFAYNRKYQKLNDYILVIDFLEIHTNNYDVGYTQHEILKSIKEILPLINEKEISTFLYFRKGKHNDIVSLIDEELIDRQNSLLKIIFEENNSTEMIRFLENNISKPIFLNHEIADKFFTLIKSIEHEDLFKVENILQKRYFKNSIENFELEISSKKHLVMLIENYIKNDLGETNKRNRKYIFEEIAKCFANQTE